MQSYKHIWVALILFFGTCGVFAASATDDYQVELPVKDRSIGTMKESLAQALEQVLVKVSGDPEVANNESVQIYLTQASDFVERYEYRLNPDESQDQKFLLQLKFSPKAVRGLLRQNTVAEDAASPETVNLRIYGVRNASDFSEVVNYVRALNKVSHVEIDTVESDNLILSLKSSKGLVALKEAIAKKNDHRLAPIENNKNDSEENNAVLSYRWIS